MSKYPKSKIYSQSGFDGVSGSGTLNYITKWTPNGRKIGNSLIYDNGTRIFVNTTTVATGYFNLVTPTSNYGFIHNNGIVSGGTYLDNSRFYIATFTAHDIGFFTGNTNSIMVLKHSNKSVGIGDSFFSPTSTIHVKGAGSTSSTYCGKFENSAGTEIAHFRDDLRVTFGANFTWVPSTGLTLNGANYFKYTDGNQASGKILTSDANGNASWQNSVVDNTAWTDVTFNAADFTSDGTWTVASGNILTNRYKIIGKTMFWTLTLTGSTISGSPTALHIVIPNSKQSRNECISMTCDYGPNTAFVEFIELQTSANGSAITLQRADDGTSPFTNDSDTRIGFSIMFEIN